jgi:hypothetical protein
MLTSSMLVAQKAEKKKRKLSNVKDIASRSTVDAEIEGGMQVNIPKNEFPVASPSFKVPLTTYEKERRKERKVSVVTTIVAVRLRLSYTVSNEKHVVHGVSHLVPLPSGEVCRQRRLQEPSSRSFVRAFISVTHSLQRAE